MNRTTSNSIAINQKLVGWITGVLLGAAGLLWFFLGSQNMWTGACLKVGLVMAALWIALPSISRQGRLGQASWGAIVATIAVALVLTGKRVDLRLILPVLIGMAIAMMILRPRSRNR